MSSLPIDVNGLVGLTLTDEMEEQLELIPNLRIKRPGYLYTMELRMNRVNVHVDSNNVITHISHG